MTPEDDARTFGLRGRILEKLGRPTEAVEQYERAVRLATSDIDVRYRLARLWLTQGEPERAHEHARWCARLRPDSQAFRQLLSQIHQARLRGAE